MSTRASQTPTGTSASLNCLRVDGVPLVEWITNLFLCCCASAHKALTLTKNQDVAQRVSLDVANQVLNVPPLLVARRETPGQTGPEGNWIAPGTLVRVTGLTTIVADTSPGVMCLAVPDDLIIIPRAGLYTLWCSAGFAGLADRCERMGWAVGADLLLNGIAGQGAVAPLGSWGIDVPVTALVVRCAAGDSVGLQVWTDFPAGVTVIRAAVAVTYLEGTL